MVRLSKEICCCFFFSNDLFLVIFRFYYKIESDNEKFLNKFTVKCYAILLTLLYRITYTNVVILQVIYRNFYLMNSNDA